MCIQYTEITISKGKVVINKKTPTIKTLSYNYKMLHPMKGTCNPQSLTLK